MLFIYRFSCLFTFCKHKQRFAYSVHFLWEEEELFLFLLAKPNWSTDSSSWASQFTTGNSRWASNCKKQWFTISTSTLESTKFRSCCKWAASIFSQYDKHMLHRPFLCSILHSFEWEWKFQAKDNVKSETTRSISKRSLEYVQLHEMVWTEAELGQI